MSFDNALQAFKTELEKLTYTDAMGETQKVNVYNETEIIRGKSAWETPALVIRGISILTSPITVGWNEFNELGEFTVSLYLKQRTTDYNAGSVREEITQQIEALAKSLKNGIGDAEYLKLTNVIERDWVEKPGTLRRDFTFEVYKES